ncbi:MAG: M23 family metallopeptidase [Alphaproteobacteria bacterium]
MNCLPRREVLAGGAALLLAPATHAKESVFWFRDAPLQGTLMLGRVPLGSRVRVDGERVRVSKGLFAFGIGRDDTKPITVRAIFPGGRSERTTIDPITRSYETQTITGLPEAMVSPPPEIQQRIAREAAMVREVRKRDTDEIWFSERLDWPAQGPISGIYGSHRVLNGEPRAPHWGVDIAAPEGWPVRAPAPAVVSLAEPDLYLTGGTIILDHGHGVNTTYLHMSRLDVEAGGTVKRGDMIGAVGKTGRATGPHLHWAMNWFQVRLDPSLAASSPAPAKD